MMQEYALRNLRLEVGRRLREGLVVAHADAELDARPAVGGSLDTFTRIATETYATKRRQLAEVRCRAADLAAQVEMVTPRHIEGHEAVAVKHDVEKAMARVDNLRAVLKHVKAETSRRRNTAARRSETARRRLADVTAASDVLRSERGALRDRLREIEPPALAPGHKDTLCREKRGRLRKLVREYGLTTTAICGIRLPPDGNFSRPVLDPATMDLGLFHTTRFLETAADLLCITLPFTCTDIGFPYGGGKWRAAARHVGRPDGDGWQIDLKAQKVNYNICALFEADGMDVSQLQPEPGSYFQTLPNLVRCVDPDANPALGTQGPLRSDRPLAQIIEGPVGEDFVLL